MHHISRPLIRLPATPTPGFANGATTGDMAAMQKFFFAQLRSNTEHIDMVYYGSEHGVFSGGGRGFSTFRADGNDIPYAGTSESPTSNNPFLNSCIMLSGNGKGGGTRADLNAACIVPESTSYICDSSSKAAFTNGDAVGSYQSCNSLPGQTFAHGSDTTALCGNYDYCTTTSTTKLAHVPRTYFCQDHYGQFCENDVKDFTKLNHGTNAKYGITSNTNKFPGNSGFCKSNGNNNGANSCLWRGAKEDEHTYDDLRHTHRGNETVCSTYGTLGKSHCVPFFGGYRTRVYDPRYRSWYKVTRNEMRSTTSSVYLMFSSGALGFTVTAPIFDFCDRVRGVAGAALPNCKTYDEIAAGEALSPNIEIVTGGSTTLTKTAHNYEVGMRVKVTAGDEESYHTVTKVADATHFTSSPAISSTATTVNVVRAKIFAGVMGIDYKLDAFNQWLIKNYGKGTGLDSKHVYIEEADTNLVVATSLEAPLYVTQEEVDNNIKSSVKDRRKTTDEALKNIKTVTPTDKFLPIYKASMALKDSDYRSCESGDLLRIALPERGDDGLSKTRLDGTPIDVPFYVQCLA